MRSSVLTFCLCIVLVGVGQADSLYFRQVGQWGTHQITGVAVKGTYAYVVGYSDDLYDGLHVLSLADVAHPVEVWRCPADSSSADVAVGGEYVYYADWPVGLRVFSISDPAHPVEVGRCTTNWATLVTVSGDYAYATGDSGLCVISIADPSHPVEVARLRSQGGWHSWRRADVVGDYAFVADLVGGLRVISVADPANPVEVGYYEPAVSTYGVAVRDSNAYIGCDGSFRVISVADPTHPVEVGALDSTSFTGWGIVLRRGYAFTAAGGNSGLWAISISDPTHPTLAGYYGGSFGWFSLTTEGDYVYYAGFGPRIFQFYQLGDLDIDNDSLDVVSDTLRLRRWASSTGSGHDRARKQGTVPRSSRVRLTAGQSPFSQSCPAPLECVRGEFMLANTSVTYNPDSIDGPSISPVDSVSVTGSLTGPGGTIDSVVVPNLPSSLAQGQTMVCSLAAYVPVGLRDGDYTGSIYVSGKDTAGLWVYESCYVCLLKLGDIDVDDDSLDVVADTIRARIPNTGDQMQGGPDRAVGAFVMVNTSAPYNPDTADGPSRSRVDSLSFTCSLAGPGGILDSIFIQRFPASLVQGLAVVCTLTVYVPDSVPVGDYVGPMVITCIDSLGCPLAETVYVLVSKEAGVLGDLDVDNDSLDVVRDTMKVRAQPAGPVYHPYAKARFMLVNTSGSYNPDAEDGPSQSTLRRVEVEAKVGGLGRKVNSECRIVKPGSGFHSSQFAIDSSVVGIYVLNLPESLAVGQAVECTLALVLPVGESLGSHAGWVTTSAYDMLGYQVRDSFFLVVRGPQPREGLDSLRVAPIPFKPNQNPEHDAIHFQGLTSGAKVVVYDASGKTVWRAVESGDGHLAWEAEVASGIYVYLVVTADGKASKVGKLSVIR